jgi:glycosyltransferase involved in cell wall biosynthesis
MARVTDPSVVYVLPDKMGGVMSLTAHLLDARRPDGFRHVAVLTHNSLSVDERFGETLNADAQTVVEYALPLENLHAVLNRLRRAIPQGEGVLVANDLLELALASAFDCQRAVIQILHGDDDYYYDLAARHETVIDAFAAIGRTIERKLKTRLPHRSADIYFLPYGLPDPPRRRTPRPGPLRLLFAGRYEHGQKGILDLPLIDRTLVERGVDVSWTMIGAGPDETKLRDAWRSPRVNFLGRRSNAEVIEIAARHDVFVLPTRYEGVPVALLEAMSVGLVPVVSNVESGVAEVLSNGQTALMPPVGDIGAFADAIAALDRNRTLLESISDAAWKYVAAHHDAHTRADAYQALFARYRELRRPRPDHVILPYQTRLDRPWLPNIAVRTVRGLIRRAQGRAL